MNTKPIEQASNPLLSKALPALERAAQRAREVARQTDTAIIVCDRGQLRRISFNSMTGEVAEEKADYLAGKETL